MRCKKHTADVSSSVGVCATCLRDRLHVIIAAQIQANQACRKSDSHQLPPPLTFPRSVSPYISRRKSDTAAAATWQLQGHRHQRFFSTPQVGPTASITVEIEKNRKSNGGRFSSLFSGLFRSKSTKPDFDSGPGVSIDSCSASPSWFSTIIPGRRGKNTRTSVGKVRRNRDRGMSPTRRFDEDEEHCHGGSSGYSSESSQGWRQTPRRTPANARRGGAKAAGHGKNVSSLVFCLSPLVRPSPNRHRSQKMPPEIVVSGESRVPPKPQLSSAPSFCKNRSRKLVDLGRYNYNNHSQPLTDLRHC